MEEVNNCHIIVVANFKARNCFVELDIGRSTVLK
jgi:hypothetical protein